MREKRWKEDEWLHRICDTERLARDTLIGFADGRPFDNNRECIVTRYFGKRSNPFVRGEEKEKGDPDTEERDWMRYCMYPVEEEGSDI